jgi:alpha-mannosidase
MLRHPSYTRVRISKIITRMGQRLYSHRAPMRSIQVTGPTDRLSYAQAQELTDFREAQLNEHFGPAWSTFWFRLEAEVPAEWAGQRVDLLWDSRSEATLWVDGRTVQGLNMTSGDRPDAILLREAAGGEKLAMQVEMACNRKFGASTAGGTYVPNTSPYQLMQCEIAAFDPQVWKMYFDATVLAQLEKALAEEGASAERSWQGYLLSELNRFANVIDEEDRSTWDEAGQILAGLYEHRNGSRVFHTSAIGHAHIDTAWLWPLAETHRKCERTFSSATAYMEDYPEYRFACSQAYQYQVIKERNPDLYARMKAAVERGQWVVVGGTWIEPDCNVPSGESLCRQFLTGQTYFEREFGFRCCEFWNPDVFGYNGQLPQILQQAGITRFLTQKLSWNYFNKPDNHTFCWRGIDGSEVITHFPPADTYNALTNVGSEVAQLRDNAGKFRDHDRASEGMMLFGYGDGGGGPTKRMLEILRRVENLQGVPPTQQRTSDEFFDRLEADCTDLPVRIGELYFELHRGTYTSQGLTKRNNRFAERALHDLEFLAARRTLVDGADYPAEAIDQLWKIVLVNQFHDILPGSSITPVYRDSEAQFEALFEEIEPLLAEARGSGSTPINTADVDRIDVIETDGALQLVTAKPYAAAAPAESSAPVTLTRDGENYVLENAHLVATLSPAGHVTKLICKASGRDTLAGPANVFEIYDDNPNNWEAWDVEPPHLETRKELPGASEHEVVREDALRVELKFIHPISKTSRLTQTVRLDADARILRFACHVTWQESRKMLKVAFPVDATSMNATYEMQFGHVERPTHYNTSFDLARFEVPMHRWFDFSEPGNGLAVLNDCKYGGSTFENVMRLSLLRSPKQPDPTCDMGEHHFAYAMMPHRGDWRSAAVVDQAIAFNHPLVLGDAIDTESFISVDTPSIVLDTIKRAEDGEGLIVRFYEAEGRRGTATLRFAQAPTTVTRTNILEDPGAAVTVDGQTVSVPFGPFQVITLRCV